MFLLMVKNWLYPWDYFQTGDHINLLFFKAKKRKSCSANLNPIPIRKRYTVKETRFWYNLQEQSMYSYFKSHPDDIYANTLQQRQTMEEAATI